MAINKIPKTDSFSLDEEIIKKRLDKTIKTSNLMPISIPETFTISKPKFTKTDYSSQIKNFIEPICKDAEQMGYGPNIFTVLYEGLLNAFQHGNLYDENKKILFAHALEHKNIEFLICDEGNELHPNFLRFILKHRQRTDHTSNFINWYKHSGEDKSNTPNQGMGTSFMHAYVDNVGYFRSNETKGLALYLNKELN